MKPNETRGESAEDESLEATCPRCGMQRENWTGDNGEGFGKEGQLYCCRGCADETGCVCADVLSLEKDIRNKQTIR